MRKITTILLLLFWKIGFGQNQEIKSSLPTIIPPSPTVSALMKFEEVAVSNYTGVPDISIPLFSSATLSKDINLNVELKYHSNGVKADETASDVGLGWSLIAGGTISRTVRGLPDEVLEYPTGLNTGMGRIGIYHKNNTAWPNFYYNFNDNLTNAEKDRYVPNQVSPEIQDKANDFIWGTSDLGRYDTEHDLWQFNFMGKTGRFYIKLNSITNSLEIVPLDEFRVKIKYNYILNTLNNNPFKPFSFEIYDENGYKYIFDIVEKSFYKTATVNYYGGETGTVFSTSFEKNNDTSFHLSKVFDNNDKLLINFTYSNEGEYTESKIDIDEIDNQYLTPNFQLLIDNYNCNNEFKPLRSRTSTTFINKVKKIKEIEITNYGSVKFKYAHQREDTNIALNNSAVALSEITIFDTNSAIVKALKFEYGYSTVLNKRMILNKIMERETDLFIDKYNFDYYNQSYDESSYHVGKDYWGYFSLIPNCINDNHDRKFPTPQFSTRDLLRKIKYETKGCTIFDFESNTYSYQGNQLITNYFEDDQNIILDHSDSMSFNSSNSNTIIDIGVFNNYKKIVFNPSIIIDNIANANKSFILFKKVNNVWVDSGLGLNCYNNSCCIEFYPEPNVIYGIKYSNLNTNISSETLTLDYYKPNNQIKEYLFGGGNRIKSINYFDRDVSSQDFQNTSNTTVPVKQKTYNYQNPNNQLKSSGSLVYVKPMYMAEKSFTIGTQCNCLMPLVNSSFSYKSFSTKNLVSGLLTQGSEIGYKYVTVKENGSISYEYTSPIEYPEEIVIGPYSHLRSINFDYKRGLLMSEIIKNNNEETIKSSLFKYSIIDHKEQTGLNFYKSFTDEHYQGVPYFLYYSELKYNFTNNINIRESNTTGSNGICFYIKSLISFHNADAIYQRNIFMRPVFEAYGWAKLSSKSTSNYFYPNGASTPNIVTTNETFSYNSLNKQIASHTVSDTLGEISTTNYFYHTGNSPTSQNRISEIERIETKKGTELLSESKINYSNTFAGNQSFLPSTIEVKKGQYPSEVRLRNNLYDEFGHVLEVEQESGVKICYIYGYNKTQPIAKIENLAYSSIPVSTIENLQNKSNADNDSCSSVPCSGNEENLRVELNALRSAYPNAIITTYTYNPLIGVTSITDPKGDVVFYNYDSFGRLESVKDKEGNMLSENKYNYRTN
jgi:YD repeat-containing protein